MIFGIIYDIKRLWIFLYLDPRIKANTSFAMSLTKNQWPQRKNEPSSPLVFPTLSDVSLAKTSSLRPKSLLESFNPTKIQMLVMVKSYYMITMISAENHSYLKGINILTFIKWTWTTRFHLSKSVKEFDSSCVSILIAGGIGQIGFHL